MEELRFLPPRQFQGRLCGIVGELKRVQHTLLRGVEDWRHPINVPRRRSCMRISAKLALAAILIAALLAGCATPPNAWKDLLAFLEAGRTTREEVLLRLGQPSGSFEQERVLTYRIGQYGEQGYFIISPKVVLPAQGASWQNVNFSLVIVFDEQGRLQRHELIRVD